MPSLEILENHLFFQKIPNFERFEKSYYFTRILRQMCYKFVKKIQVQKRERTSGNEKRFI